MWQKLRPLPFALNEYKLSFTFVPLVFFSVVVSVFFKTILIIFLFFIFQKPTKYKAPYSSDCKLHYELRGKVVLGLGPIEAITQQKGKIADLFYRHITTKLNIVGSRNISPKEENSQVRRTHLI